MFLSKKCLVKVVKIHITIKRQCRSINRMYHAWYRPDINFHCNFFERSVRMPCLCIQQIYVDNIVTCKKQVVMRVDEH